MPAVERVLMTADCVGGVWTYALDLCRELASRGAEVALATMGAPLQDEQRRDAEAIPRLSIFESDYRLEWMADPWEDIRHASDWLLELESQLRPDIVHLNQYAFGALPFQAPGVVVGHSCVCSWWRAVHGSDAPQEWDRYRRLVTAGLRGAAARVAPTRAMRSSLREHYGSAAPIGVIHNGSSTIVDAVEKEPFVLAAGRLWDEAKNLRALDQAAAETPWPVYVAGDSDEPGRTPAPVAGGMAARRPRAARYLGRLSRAEMADWMGRAAVYAAPALYEPFGLSILEAARCGCALVLGDIPSLREVWNGSAIFVPPRDAEALAGELRRLADSQEERIDLAARARRRSLDLTSTRAMDAYLALYEDLLWDRAPFGPRVAQSNVRSASKNS